MKFKLYILFILTSALSISGITLNDMMMDSSPQTILIWAGADRTVCQNQSLILTDLGAYIQGDVTNGDWIPLGDGKFQPGNLSSVRFQYAQTNQVTYVPGTSDKALGFYQLMLISDAPAVGQKGISTVRITFQSAPPLFCSNNINISLNESCTQKVDVTMLQPNPVQPYSNYIITLYDPAGNSIADNILTKLHIDKEITYKLGHQCTSNFCWGKFKVEDHFPPVFACRRDTILCTKSPAPESVGFPLPVGAVIDTLINNKYIVKNWDACSNVSLEYSDDVVKAGCARDEDRTITRKWKATDAKGNASTCHQTIVIKRLPLSAVVFPGHFDGQDNPAFECGTNFPILANGHPSPDTTGRPGIGWCDNLQFNMTDVRFDLCGKSFKIARAWFVIDWCTSASINKNQIIVVKDSKPPLVKCQDTISIVSGAYQCATDKIEVLPPLKVLDCSDYSYTISLTSIDGVELNQFVSFEQQKYYFNNLPVGNYYINYRVTDICNNASNCKSIVKVSDKTAPFAVCQQKTKAGLDAQGRSRVFAASFNKGSSDNCGIAGFRVRKMSDRCGFGTDFGSFVDFCCDELGSVQMVVLEVSDIYGNVNTCMVEVTLEDKLKPSITCPPDITLACTDNYDFQNLDIFGKVVTKSQDIRQVVVNNYYHQGVVGIDGLASDNCSVDVTSSFSNNIQCHIGIIRRKFIAIDAGGLKDSCFQTITIRNPFPFTESDITWPLHYESSGCKISQTDPLVTGAPIFKNTSCATVAASYDDKKYYIADGACIKIIRTWTVIDWCQFTGNNSIGKYGPYIQIIKLQNTDRPEFTTNCRDTLVCSYDSNCKSGLVHLTQSAADPCTDAADLIWKFDIDIFNNGTIDTSGQKNEIYATYPIGKHKVIWRVEDQCGNFNTCTQFFTVYDCKKPSPYCISSLTLSLMQPNGIATIWAKDFDLGSTDNCTPGSELRFTFNGAIPVEALINKVHYFKGNGLLSDETEYKNGIAQIWLPDTGTSGMYFGCDDLPDGISATIHFNMTVTDLQGNQDFCSVELKLQDNANLCPDLITNGKLEGAIRTLNNKVPSDISVKYKGVEIEGTAKTDNSAGKYQVTLPFGKKYTLTPSLNSDPLEGVSTLDLVFIQRHILGLTLMDSPYKLIAADVNASGSITASDLLELRKLILGVTSVFPKGQNSWTFVAAKDGIANPDVPHNYKNYVETPQLTGDLSDLDFVAVKLGDVNLSALNVRDEHTENRNPVNKIFEINTSVESIGDKKVLSFRSSKDIKIDGLQIFCTYQDAENLFKDDVSGRMKQLINDDVYINNDKLRFIIYPESQLHYQKNEIIKSFEVEGDIDISGLTLDVSRKSEVYLLDDVLQIELRHIINDKQKDKFLLVTNPVTSVMTLSYNNQQNHEAFTYSIFNAAGEIVTLPSKINLTSSHDEFNITLNPQLPPGIYVLHISSPSYSQSIRFILVR